MPCCRRSFWGCALVLCAWSVAVARPAQAENVELAVQGALSSNSGGPVADGAYPMGVAFYADKTGGTALWTELFLGVQVKNGLFATILGAAASKLDAATFTAGKPIYVGVTIGTDPELPRDLLRRVPLAIHALQANSAADIQCSGCVGSDDMAKGAVTGEKIASGAVGANHVSFAWAAADSAGGAATFALDANKAKQAENAKTADSAAFADEANSAKLATGLKCTGCVSTDTVAKGAITLDKLSQDVAGGFVSTKGGTISGALTVSGGVDLQGSALTKAAIASGDAKTATCTDKQAGQLLFDAATKRLFLCDGTKQLRFTVCSELCAAPGSVDCGKTVSDGCGDASNACGTGTKCGAGLSCSGGSCTSPGSQNSPVISCAALQTANPQAKTGAYWLDPDGAGAGKAFQTWCDMDTAGGGWTLVSVIASQDGVASMSCGLTWDYKSALWTDGNVFGATDFDEAKDHKYLSYSEVPFGDFLMVEKVGGKVGYKQWKVGAQSSFAGLMGGGCATLADNPVTSGGTISSDNALIFSNNLKRNCNSDYTNGDDLSRLHGNNPNNPQGNCYNGGWGLGVDGDAPNCEWASEARPQYGGWSTQCYSETGYYTGGELCGAGCNKHHDAGTFTGSLFVR